MEQRAPSSLLSKLSSKAYNAGSIITPLVVNRAASSKSMAQLEEFYVNGMGTKKTHDETKNGVTKKCFLWTGASVHVCFTERADSATKGDWKVADFENMLNTVHKNLM